MSDNLTVQQKLNQEAFAASVKPINDQLAILRATRGQRDVGTLKVPAHLQQPNVVTLTAPRGSDPRMCKVCGTGLGPADISRGICTRCADNPNTDIGVESRADIAAVRSL